MRQYYQIGRLDTEAEFVAAETLLGQHAGSYDPSTYKTWLYDKQGPRWRSGQSGLLGIVAARGERLAHLTTVNIFPASTEQDLPLVEIKATRTEDSYRRQGLGRVGLRQAIILGGVMLDVAPGDPVRIELDARADNPDLPYFEALGLTALHEADVYNEGSLDVRFGMTTSLPLGSNEQT